jgi:hypothetical protein
VSVIQRNEFSGRQPRTSPRLLPDSSAQVATNVRLSSGALAPFAKEKLVIDWPGHAIESVFRMEDDAGTEVWLAWERDVDAVSGPIADDSLQRVYYSGDNEPRVTTLALATSGSQPYPSASYVLGVFPPSAAPALVASGGSGTTQLRAARFTLVTEWGEESAPSPAVTATGYPNGTWTFSSLGSVPGNTYTATGGSWASGVCTLTGVTSTFGLRKNETVVLAGFTPAAWNGKWKVSDLTASTIKFAMTANPGAVTVVGTINRDAPHHTTGMVRRFYMTFGSVDEYFHIGDAPVATASPAFVNPQIGDPLDPVNYEMPPADLISLRTMANGICVGLSGKEVCFSVPFRPHAWPSKYQQTVDYQPVGCEVSGTTVVIGTVANPYTITGVDPATMGGGAVKMKRAWPCLSKRAMVSSQFGVIYPTVEGFVVVGESGADLLYPDLFTRLEMADIYPETMKAAMFGNAYVGFYQTPETSRAVFIDRTETWRMIDLDIGASFPYVDSQNGLMYYQRGHNLYQFEGEVGERIYFDWWSKSYLLPRPQTFNTAQVRFDATMTPAQIQAAQDAIAAVIAANQALIAVDDNTRGSWGECLVCEFPWGMDAMADLPPAKWDTVHFQLYVDGVLRASIDVQSERPFRLPTGYRGDVVSVRIQGNVMVHAWYLATSMPELRQVPA